MAAGAEVARGAPKEVLANSLVREIYLGESPSVTDDHPADQAHPAEPQPEQPQPAEQPRYSR